jgi:hypothetical protein
MFAHLLGECARSQQPKKNKQTTVSPCVSDVGAVGGNNPGPLVYLFTWPPVGGRAIRYINIYIHIYIFIIYILYTQLYYAINIYMTYT